MYYIARHTMATESCHVNTVLIYEIIITSQIYNRERKREREGYCSVARHTMATFGYHVTITTVLIYEITITSSK